ncbi:MAG: carbamate kinase [archaeon YNP-LCB-024-027]|jgi:carbamate kinase|nr:carbamate kinase [Candidatus Culexarchaeum yellowstonense]
MHKRILVALGGNAIKKAEELGTYEEQLNNIHKTCIELSKLIEMGYDIVITHGNGPQVGNLLIQQEAAAKELPPQPLDVLGAMTQGHIGYLIQRTLRNILTKKGIKREVATIITQVEVNKNDPAFKNPTKPIGPFYDEKEAEEKIRMGMLIKKVKIGVGKTYRRVVPSPEPIRILEGKVIKKLVDEGVIVIASGGGGIPVTLENDEYTGVEAVIDKDLAGEKLAEIINADILLILTDVEKVKLNFGKPNELDIDKMTVEEAKRYYEEGHFPPGSMGPKIQACIRFIEWGGEMAIITSLEKAAEALEGKTGTRIYRG